MMTKKSTREPSPRVTFSTDPHDPPYWPVGLMAIEKIDLLAKAEPAQFQAVHTLVDFALREAWRKLGHADILRLLDLEESAGRPYHWTCDEPRVTKPRGDA
jgi:hypothetical protein